MREEGEPLTLEIRLPLRNLPGTRVPVKLLAQVFGRGVGIIGGKDASDLKRPKGGIERLVSSHDGAPATLVYKLESEFSYLDKSDLHLLLREDGRCTLASLGNPLLEFYDGGWHVVDLQSASVALHVLLSQYFMDAGFHPDLAKYLLRLAYYLATHGHGAILAVVNPDSIEDILEDQNDKSRLVTQKMRDAMSAEGKSERIVDVPESKLGRLFLSSSMQDGALLFDSTGRFLSAGRIVGRTDEEVEGGARRHAATTLSKYGVVIMVSQDGAVRLYSEKDGSPLTPKGGLRTH